MQESLRQGREALAAAVSFILAHGETQPSVAYSAAVPYLRLAGVVLCGWQMARSLQFAVARRDEDPDFYDARIALARFYAEALMPQADALRRVIDGASTTVADFPCELL